MDEGIEGGLGRLRIARYRLTLEATTRLSLPPFKGSTLRGGFGGAFKTITCAQRDRKASRRSNM